MNLRSFENLLSIVNKYIEPIDETKALNSRPNAGRVPVVIELACTLRYLAGGQVTDLMQIYKPISRNRHAQSAGGNQLHGAAKWRLSTVCT